MDEYQIVELVKDRYRTGSIKADNNFLLNDTTIISNESYENSYIDNESISEQVIGYVNMDRTDSISILEFPMLSKFPALYVSNFILYAYLYKKGYVVISNNPFGPAPLPNLKYIIYCIKTYTEYEFKDKLVIELVDLDVAANNLNLPNIVSSVLGPKLLSKSNIIEDTERNRIIERTHSQKLFAGHTWDDAYRIVHLYFDENKRELSKEVFKISEAYQQVFRPYRVVYNTKTWLPVVM